MTDYLKQAFSLATCTLEGDEREKAFKKLEEIEKELEKAIDSNPFLGEQQKDSTGEGQNIESGTKGRTMERLLTSPATNKPSELFSAKPLAILRRSSPERPSRLSMVQGSSHL